MAPTSTAIPSPTLAPTIAPTPTAVRAAPTPTLAIPIPTARPAAAPTQATAAAPTVDSGDDYFNPALLEVPVGTTVTWRISGAKPHDAIARDGSFSSPVLTAGQAFTFTFRSPGRYPYYCSLHEGQGMFGEVVVK